METITCIFCKTQQEDRVLIQENGYTGRKCEHCGLIYISPRPSLAEIRNLYGDDQAHISAEAHKAQGFSKRLQARHHLAILKRYITGGSLLDIGAGAGFFLDEARKNNFDVYGIEWNDSQVDFIRNTLNIKCDKTTLRESFGSKNFDVIYHCDVISHFYDPLAEFTIMNQRLNPGGILMFETGNGDFDEKYLSAFTSFQYPDHLFFFSERNIRDLLARTGFELLHIYKWSIIPQLTAKKFLSKFYSVRSSGSGNHRKTPSRSGRRPSVILSVAASAKMALAAMMLRMFEILSYILRYKIGYIYSKQKQPYTMIVVARKPHSRPAER